MEKHTRTSFSIFALGLFLFASGCGYNKIQGLDEEVKAAWSEVQNQYQRRADLVPNLVATVKGAWIPAVVSRSRSICGGII